MKRATLALGICSFLAIVIASFAAVRDAKALAQPLRSFGAKVVTVTTTAQSITQLIGSSANSGCAVKIANPTTTVVCVGGSDVNTTTTAGGTCYPLCSTAGTCAEQAIPIDGNAANVYLRVASGTQAVFLLNAGGC